MVEDPQEMIIHPAQENDQIDEQELVPQPVEAQQQLQEQQPQPEPQMNVELPVLQAPMENSF